jgi:hypothetical protein
MARRQDTFGMNIGGTYMPPLASTRHKSPVRFYTLLVVARLEPDRSSFMNEQAPGK